jgi:hypothetical protein
MNMASETAAGRHNGVTHRPPGLGQNATPLIERNQISIQPAEA